MSVVVDYSTKTNQKFDVDKVKILELKKNNHKSWLFLEIYGTLMKEKNGLIIKVTQFNQAIFAAIN